MKKVLLILLVILAITSVFTSGMAKSDYTVSCEEITQIDTGGGAADITISDNYAYICDGLDDTPGGLVIIDISDPTNPIKISSFFDGGLPHDVTVRDNTAYVADGTDGLEIINVSNPSNPSKIGSYKIANMYTTAVKVFGDFAYIGDLHLGLFKLSITNLSDPVKINSIPFYSCPSIDVSSNFLITVNHQEYYSGLEIRDPENFTKLGEYTPSNTDFIHPVILQNLVFATNHHQNTGEVQIINISDPSNPVLESKYYGGSVAQRCFVEEDFLYVPCSDAGVDIVDISNPAQPEKIGSYSDNNGVAFDLFVKDNIAFVADGSDGLEIIQMTIKENSKDVNGFSLIGGIIAMQLIIGIKNIKKNR